MDAIGVVSDIVDLDGARAELVIWLLPRRVPGSHHNYKYRLALISNGECVMRFDNEAGKGDHRHLGRREFAYDFIDVETLVVDFWTEVSKWLNSR